MTNFKELLSIYHNEVNHQLGHMQQNDPNVGSISWDISGLVIVTGNSSLITDHYVHSAIKTLNGIVPRGKAWTKLYNVETAGVSKIL